jgi:hypothetical protein
MAQRNAQTHAKRAREFAVKEKRELKRAKKAMRAAAADEASSVDAPFEAEPSDSPTDEASSVDAPFEAESSDSPTESEPKEEEHASG